MFNFPSVYSYTADSFDVKVLSTSLSAPTGFDSVHVPRDKEIVVRLS